METEDVINSLALNLLFGKDLIVTGVEFLAAHDANVFKILRRID